MKEWLKNSLLDNNGKPSGRRLTGLWFVILTTILVAAGIHNVFVGRVLPTNFLYFLMIMVTVVMLYGLVITVDKIVEIIKVIRSNNNNP